jgi:hypothetical protein
MGAENSVNNANATPSEEDRINEILQSRQGLAAPSAADATTRSSRPSLEDVVETAGKCSDEAKAGLAIRLAFTWQDRRSDAYAGRAGRIACLPFVVLKAIPNHSHNHVRTL